MNETRPLLLLVEDDDLLASVMTEILAPVADVRWAASAEQAMQVLSDEHWDLVIADIELPGMSGIDFIVHSKVAQPVTIGELRDGQLARRAAGAELAFDHRTVGCERENEASSFANR